MDRLQRLEELVIRMSEQLPAHASRVSSTENGLLPLNDVIPDTSIVFGTIKAHQATPVSLAQSAPTPKVVAHHTDSRHLEDVGTRDNSILAGLSDGITFKIIPLREMFGWNATLRSEQPLEFASNLNQPRQVCLPLKEEALFLFEIYIKNVSYLHHIIHVPTARAIVHEVYSDANVGQMSQSVSFGKTALVLSMIASAVSFQVAVGVEDLTSIPVSQARLASRHFMKSTVDVLEHFRRIGVGTLEYVQATIGVVFHMYNLEGFSARVRIGFGDALSVARDIGLHRTDYEPDAPQLKGISEVEKEVRRRVWWHMTGSDWALALSGGPTEGIYNIHPAHLACCPPRNLNDEQVATAPPSFSHPLSTPTYASYLIQRMRLATVCRRVVDMMPLNPSNPDAIPYSQFLELDEDFQTLLDDLPYFFKLDPESRRMAQNVHQKYPHIAIQKYMINMTANTRRCKLHQPFLVRGFTIPTYRHSRDVCLHSARTVLQIKKEMAADRLFASALANLSGINCHIFFAAIVLVMDLYFNKTGSGSDRDEMTEEERKQDVWEVCNMLKEAKDTNVSLVAARFLASLTEVLRKHRVRVEGIEDAADNEPWEVYAWKAMTCFRIPPAGYADQEPMTAPGRTWQDHPLPDFDDVFQGYIDQGPKFEITDWEHLFSELEPQFNS